MNDPGVSSSDVLSLAEVVAAIESLYDPAWAAEWDAVGLVTGDPAQDVRRMVLAVDPAPAVVAEAVEWGADLIVTHHPLLLRGVHTVATTHPKGRTVNALVRNGIGLYVAHTNADVADPGVSDALATAIGLTDLRPLVPDASDPRRGLGRVGRWLAAGTLRELADAVAAGLPATRGGVRVGGDLDRVVRSVAVCGGAGDDLFDDVRAAGVDVYVTSDLRHHPAAEALEHGSPALVDVSHWAGEWPWLADCERRLRETLGSRADTVDTRVSTLVTDPWAVAVPSPARSTP